jgi:hypothetical protein
MTDPLSLLLVKARYALNIGSQGALGQLLGSSRRSGERWARGQARPLPSQLLELARRVQATDRALAATIAARAGGKLDEPSGPRALTMAVGDLVDVVVCAAADAMNLPPEAVRPALRAAFHKARIVGLTVEEVEGALAPKKAASKQG